MEAPRIFRASEKTPMPKTDWKMFTGKVLVAEDNMANRVLIETLLKKHGLEVTMTENGQQAVDAAMANTFDLILLDMQMPVMNGYEAAAALREKGIPTLIIALTASVMVGDRQKCLDAGCDDFLGKPINRQQLQQVLEEALSDAFTPAIDEQIDELTEQTKQLNQCVDAVIPTVPQSILTEDTDD